MFFPKHLFLVEWLLHAALTAGRAGSGLFLQWRERHSNVLCNFVLCAGHLCCGADGLGSESPSKSRWLFTLNSLL